MKMEPAMIRGSNIQTPPGFQTPHLLASFVEIRACSPSIDPYNPFASCRTLGLYCLIPYKYSV
jgi:hypothetical protein